VEVKVLPLPSKTGMSQSQLLRRNEDKKRQLDTQTKKDVAAMKNLFDQADGDGNGSITTAELNEAFGLKLGLSDNSVFTFQNLLTFKYPSASLKEIEALAELATPKPVPKSLVEAIRTLFDHLDTTFSGKVPLPELLPALRRMPGLAEYIAFIPQPQEEREVTLHELFTQLFKPMHKRQMAELFAWAPASRALTKAQRQEIQKLFYMFDRKNTGFISIAEFRRTSLEMFEISDDQADPVFQFESEREGYLNMFEFVQFYRGVWEVQSDSFAH
jgi:Ca2+-binding EF-hand superfamily protein